MKKGRHRRFEEARALKRGPDIDIEALLDPDADPLAEEKTVNGRSGWYEEDVAVGDD